MQVVLDESAELVRAERGVLIAARATASSARTRASTPPTPPAADTLVLLPRDPDA